MSELTTVTQMTSLEVAEITGKSTFSYSERYKMMIEKLEFTERISTESILD